MQHYATRAELLDLQKTDSEPHFFWRSSIRSSIALEFWKANPPTHVGLLPRLPRSLSWEINSPKKNTGSNSSYWVEPDEKMSPMKKQEITLGRRETWQVLSTLHYSLRFHKVSVSGTIPSWNPQSIGPCWAHAAPRRCGQYEAPKAPGRFGSAMTTWKNWTKYNCHSSGFICRPLTHVDNILDWELGWTAGRLDSVSHPSWESSDFAQPPHRLSRPRSHAPVARYTHGAASAWLPCWGWKSHRLDWETQWFLHHMANFIPITPLLLDDGRTMENPSLNVWFRLLVQPIVKGKSLWVPGPSSLRGPCFPFPPVIRKSGSLDLFSCISWISWISWIWFLHPPTGCWNAHLLKVSGNAELSVFLGCQSVVFRWSSGDKFCLRIFWSMEIHQIQSPQS